MMCREPKKNENCLYKIYLLGSSVMLALESIHKNNKFNQNIWTQANFDCVKRRIEQITAKIELVIEKPFDSSDDENSRE
jgi:hypothetical protein